jgi:hypothetical protein
MTDALTIHDFDRDDAVAEALDGLEQEGTTRGTWLRRAGLFAGAGAAASVLTPAIAGARDSGSKKNDVKILNYALTLEYLESAFYERALEGGHLHGSALQFARVVAGHERVHVETLQGVLGSKAVKKGKYDFKGTTHHTDTFLKTSKVLEDTGVAAYQGQAPLIHQNAVLEPAGAILAVEARHASWVRDLLGAGKTVLPAPEAFSTPMSMSQVLKAVKATGFITG